MTDIHMHLIPGVDDGAADVLMALAMMDQAKREGITAIFATPHSSAFDASPAQVAQQLEALKHYARKYFPDLKLLPGCEVLCDAFSMEATVAALDARRYPTLNGTAYVLAEFSPWVQREQTAPCVEKLTAGGYIPVIAHMERYLYLRGDMALVDRLRELGALIQVNTYDLQDTAEPEIRDWARTLVKAGKADFLGSDAHRTGHRPPRVREGLRWLYETVCEDYADALACGNAERLLIRMEDTNE